jgi:diguanylate cyclase (GGDEF)-like protein/PAS domain S-box-containing protein
MSVGTTDAEELIQQLEHTLRLLNLSHEAILCVDDDCQVVLLNQGAEKIFGYAREQLIGQPVTTLLCPDYRVQHYQRLAVLGRIARDSQLGFHAEQVIAARCNGDRFPCELSVSRNTAASPRLFTLVARDISRQVDQQRQLTHSANHDQLTDLPNRQLLAERLSSGIAHADRNGRKLGVVYLDLNRFKPVNDCLGHETGDCLLQAVARRLSDSMRRTDTVSRIGGDEFIVCLEQLKNTQDAIAATHKLIAAFAKPFQVLGRSLAVSASIGLAIYPDHGRDANTLLRCADQAMYKAKSSHRKLALFRSGKS